MGRGRRLVRLAGLVAAISSSTRIESGQVATTRAWPHATTQAATSAPAGKEIRDLAALLEPIRAKHDVPALAGAIIDGDRVVALGAVGVRKRGAEERITTNDSFHIGSCTKAMTATLVAMLVEQGKLKWDTTIADVFPDLRNSMHADFRDVTLEQLLTHRGGVPGDLSAGGLWGRLWNQSGSPVEQRQALLEGVIKNAPANPPGTKFEYANGGFAIAGHIAETVVGEPWEALITRMLFKPLDMGSAGFGAPGTPKELDQPCGHTDPKRGTSRAIDPGPRADNPPAIGPGGTVHCTLGDWAKFVALHLRGERGESNLLSADSFKKLHTPAIGQDYAMGWSATTREWGGRVLTHSGSNTMWFAVVWISPEKDFAVLAASNQGGDAASKACDQAASGMIQELLALRGGQPKSP